MPEFKMCEQCGENSGHIELDRTPMECECYIRGCEDAFKVMVDNINYILDGKDDGTGVNYEPWGTLRRRLLELVKK